jgi:hypothetical protein
LSAACARSCCAGQRIRSLPNSRPKH